MQRRDSLILDNLHDAVMVTDLHGRILEWNPAAERIYGYSRSEMLGEPAGLLNEPAQAEAIRRRILRGIREDGRWEGEIQFIRADGTKGTSETVVVPLLEDQGKNTAFIGINRDISDRKSAEGMQRESESRFRTIFNAAKIGMLISDRDGIPVMTNPMFQQMMGYRPDELSRMCFVDYTHPDDVKYNLSLFNRVAEGKLDQYEIEKRYIRKDGSQLWAFLAVSRFPAPASSRDFVIVMVHDITARKEMEQELLATRRDLERRVAERTRELESANAQLRAEIEHRHGTEAALRKSEGRLQDTVDELRRLAGRLDDIREEERSRIAREIHDELGQSLTALNIDLHWLKGRSWHDAETTGERLDAMSKLVKDTLESVHRIHAALRPTILDDLGLEAVIEWQARDFERRTGIECNTSVPDPLPDLSHGQSTALFRILQESLTNVMRHAQAKRVEVRLVCRHDELTLTVQDNGIGISQDALSSGKSFGFLSMRERALAWGGSMEASSEKGGGTLIAVRMPVHTPRVT